MLAVPIPWPRKVHPTQKTNRVLTDAAKAAENIAAATLVCIKSQQQ
jgi:hypothetical protein